jgi:replicative DNA helicase Mcm
MPHKTDHELLAKFEELYQDYYHKEIGKLAEHYPKEQQGLTIQAKDLYKKNPALLDDWVDQPDQLKHHAEETLALYDLPIDIDLHGAHVRLADSHGYLDRKGIGDLHSEDLGTVVALRTQIGKVSERKPRLKEGAFECQRCGTRTRMEQPWGDTNEPHQCQGCERQGPFRLNEAQSEWVDQRKLRLEEPPEKQSNGQLIAYCLDELADAAGGNLQDKAGSRVTIIGKLEADESSLFGRGNNEPVPDRYFVPQHFEWDENDHDRINVQDHLSDIKDWANRDNAIEIFKQNIDPSLVVTEGWDDALEMATCWLFGGPRIDPTNGDTVRGDLHMLFVSDPGMNKSAFAGKLAELSPKALKKDSEGMSSDVALTAAATRDGFGDESWSIEPGAGPKANGGHLILDEIDKGPDGFLNGMHSLLEGEQTLHVEKAGQEATLATRFGFLALGNPTEGRFDPYEPIDEQVDVHPALMSRFDLICTMTDSPDESADRDIAEGVLDSIDESARLDHGDLELEQAENVAGEVDRDTMRAWVKYARESIQPMLTDEAKQTLADYYVDTRQLNDDEDDTPPVTARTLPAGWRIAAAYARVELSEEITERHATRAIDTSKKIVKNNLDPDTGTWDANRTTETPSSQQERIEAIEDEIRSKAMTVEELSEATGIEERKVEDYCEKLSRQGEAYKPSTGEYKHT